MKKNIILSLACWTCSFMGQAQFTNEVIHFPFGNPNFGQMYILEDAIYLPIIYPGGQSTLVKLDSGFSPRYYHFTGFDFARESINQVNGELLFYAKDRNQNNGLKVGQWNEDDSFQWINEYRTEEESDFPINSISVGNHLYFNYVSFKENGLRDFRLKKIDTSGNLIWTKEFNQDRSYSQVFDMEKSSDNKILISGSFTNPSNFERNAQLIKTDVSGNIDWIKETEEAVSSGSEPVWITQLNNENLVQAYVPHISELVDFYQEHWNPRPIRLRWYNKDGLELKDKLLINKEKYHQFTRFEQVEAGKGDYFFAYGSFNDLSVGMDEYHGLVIKFNNNGDTIWAKKYRNPEFDRRNVAHSIIDLEELDNGDLIMAGLVTPRGERSEIWLMRTNVEGCLSNSNCGDIVISNLKESDQMIEKEVNLFPNPAKSIVQVEVPYGSFEKLDLYNTQGKFVLCVKHTTFSIDHLPRGLYWAKIKVNGKLLLRELLVY